MYVDELNDAAKRLLDVARNPDATSEDVQGALYAAKVTLDKLDRHAKESLPEH